MLSKAQIKFIRSLSIQKYRNEHKLFIAEGEKIVTEWLQSNASIQMIIGIEEWMNQHEHLLAKHHEVSKFVVSESVLESISTLQTPNKALIVISFPDESKSLPTDEWTIVLEHLQDPGNMGTIIRIADWFGIKNIVCSEDCVDIYNPKVIQSAMGSHLRVLFHFSTIESYLNQVKIPVLAATLDGNILYQFQPFEKAVLLIGNESKGLSDVLTQKANHKITIPKTGKAESLNAAVATGILCSHLKK
jgi:TrmH family RNA methyltransferase